MSSAVTFIINTIFDVVCFLFLARMILQASRADFYNPISQGVVKATDPLLRPIRLLIPGFRNFDIAALLAAWLTKSVGFALIVGLEAQMVPGIPYVALRGLFEMLRLLLTIYWFGLIIVIVLSFIAQGTNHPAALLLHQITEPVLAPARRLLPPMGGLDFSPILVFMVLILIRDYLLPAIFNSLIG
ncbi:MAG: YggT family protein [Gammaproteobacteria bacterium]|nr:YggT family protein [Gammaproteobacteria bacterium]